MATLKEVAKLTGLSAITISRVVNNFPNVKDATRQKVLAAMKEVDYRPNLIARSLVKSKTNTIGVLLPNIANPFYPEVVLGIENMARKRGYSVIICNAHTYDSAISNIDVLLSKKVDGLIIMPMSFERESKDILDSIKKFYDHTTQLAYNLINENIFMVFLNYDAGDGISNRVFNDNVVGGYMATEHLISLGHRLIGHITEIWDSGLWDQRIRGYRDTLKKYNICLNETDYVQRDKELVEGGYAATKRLLALPEPPTAIYAANDIFAIGAINAIRDANLKVPDDISVIGYDGVSFGEMIVPKLTTISHKRYETGEVCVDSLLNEIERQSLSHDLVLKPFLSIRESTGPVKKG